MIKKLTIALGTIAVIAVGATMFAGFESHLIDVRAHVEKATWVEPSDVNFGITIMEQKYDYACEVDSSGGVTGNCMKIHLSASFLEQTSFRDVTYNIYCEDKAPTDPHRIGPPALDGNITPFIRLTDSDPADHNDGVLTDGCGVVEYGHNARPMPIWAFGELIKGGIDETDLWDMSFFAPLCADNYNSLTDPIDPRTVPGGGLIDPSFCHKGPGGGPNNQDSDEYTNLGSNVKFQVTGLSVAVTGNP